MDEGSDKPLTMTIRMSDASMERSRSAYLEMLRNPPELTATQKAMQEYKATGAPSYLNIKLPQLDPALKSVGVQTDVNRFRLLAANVDDTVAKLGIAPSAVSRFNLGVFEGVAPKITASMFGKQFSAARVLGLSLQDMAPTYRAAMKIPTIEQMLGPGVLAHMKTITADAAQWQRNVQILSPVPQPTVRPGRTPVRHRAEVRRFLTRLDPEALPAFDGIYEVHGLSHGINQSAFSATELMKLVVFTLVSQDEVNAYVRQRGVKRAKHHAFEKIADKYPINRRILLSLANNGQLADDLQDVKHHRYTMSPADAQIWLDELVEDLENLIVFLQQSITQ